MQDKYVSDIIGEEYESWRRGDVILVNTPTGSGKTTFVFDKLLPDVIKNEGKMLYLVNRRVLLEQLDKELKNKVNKLLRNAGASSDSIDKYFTITTYQSIEKGLLQSDAQRTISWIRSFHIVVYDECHYFYNDSNFNTYTELSFDCLRTEFNHKVQIFMSATIKNMKDFIKNRFIKDKSENGWRENIPQPYLLHGEEGRYKDYMMKPKYDFVNLKIFNTEKEMKKRILEQGVKEKWLIFTDSIKDGRELKKLLSKELKGSSDEKDKDSSDKEDNPVGFIDARYMNDEEGTEIVEELTGNKLTSKRILIATAVIDNGISLIDYELRNIVILADTEESFIQMLGRKRPDGRTINLYICRRDSDHFGNRLKYVRKILSFYNDCAVKLNEIYSDTKTDGFVFPYHYYYLGNNNCNRTPEQIFIKEQNNTMIQQRFFEEIYASNQKYTYAKKISYPLFGRIALNSFSVRKFEDLSEFYSDMIEKLEIDDDAFVKQQAEWLNIGLEDVERFIQQSNDEIEKQHRSNIIDYLEKNSSDLLEKPFDSKLNKKMKKDLQRELEYFIKKENSNELEENRNILQYLGQNDRTISCDDFNYCMQLAGLQYKMNGRLTLVL